MVLRWGVASAAKIAHDFVTAVNTLPPGNHVFEAIAARSQSSANEFAAKHDIPLALEGYKALAELPNIDIVYVAVVNTYHLPVAKMMLEHGKHVLCEKPLSMNENQTRELIDCARNKGLFLMEAVWSRCFPAYDELRKCLSNGVIGEVLHASVTFGHRLEHVERLNVKELGGGTILDLGVYTLQFTQFVFSGLKPEKVTAAGHLNKYGTDESANAILLYPGKKTATVTSSARCLMPNEAIVIGTLGTIKIPQFWCPTEIIIKINNAAEEIRNFPILGTDESKYNFHNSVGLRYEADEAKKCIEQKLVESPKITHNESLELAQLMDKLRKDIGVVYKEDTLL